MTQVARLVLELVRGDGYEDIRDKLARLEQFTTTLQETDKHWTVGVHRRSERHQPGSRSRRCWPE